MKILVLTTGYPIRRDGCSGVFVHRLAQALALRGHEMRVITPAQNDAVGRMTVDGISVLAFRYALRRGGHVLTSLDGGIPEAMRRSPLARLQVPAMLARFCAAAAKQARWADVIHANWLGAGIAGAAARMLSGTPMVLTLRGDDAYNIRDSLMWRTVGKAVFRRCAAVTAVSENMPPIIDPYLPARCRPAVAPAFGVDSELFHPPAAGTPRHDGKSLRGLFVGNIVKAKGVDLLLKALAGCRSEWERFEFIGAGPDADRMRALADELELGDSIVWTGRAAPQAVAERMRAADFFVLPSLSEGRPNVVMEAMASALPIIATRVGGIPHMLSDGQTGLLVPPGDVEGLTAAVTELCRSEELRDRLGRNAREHIDRENLTWDRTAEEFEKIFKQVCGP